MRDYCICFILFIPQLLVKENFVHSFDVYHSDIVQSFEFFSTDCILNLMKKIVLKLHKLCKWCVRNLMKKICCGMYRAIFVYLFIFHEILFAIIHVIYAVNPSISATHEIKQTKHKYASHEPAFSG